MSWHSGSYSRAGAMGATSSAPLGHSFESECCSCIPQTSGNASETMIYSRRYDTDDPAFCVLRRRFLVTPPEDAKCTDMIWDCLLCLALRGR